MKVTFDLTLSELNTLNYSLSYSIYHLNTEKELPELSESDQKELQEELKQLILLRHKMFNRNTDPIFTGYH